MAFFSAALGQAALTGVAIGLLLGEPLNAPYGGMFGFCLLSTLAMVFVKRHERGSPNFSDARVGGHRDVAINRDRIHAVARWQ